MLLDEPFTGVDVKTESAIIDLLRELRQEGHIILVSTHNLGSVPDFCDQVVLINRTVLAFGPTEEVFTEKNLARTFGGVLRHFKFDHTDVPGSARHEILLLSDDERPLVLGEDGHPSPRGPEHEEGA
jgi:manganese/iron transport system ATP-binding protein